MKKPSEYKLGIDALEEELSKGDICDDCWREIVSTAARLKKTRS